MVDESKFTLGNALSDISRALDDAVALSDSTDHRRYGLRQLEMVHRIRISILKSESFDDRRLTDIVIKLTTDIEHSRANGDWVRVFKVADRILRSKALDRNRALLVLPGEPTSEPTHIPPPYRPAHDEDESDEGADVDEAYDIVIEDAGAIVEGIPGEPPSAEALPGEAASEPKNDVPRR